MATRCDKKDTGPRTCRHPPTNQTTAYAPAYGLCLHPERTRGLSAAFGIELRGAGEMTVRFTDGAYELEEAGVSPVDATISADPVALLMVGAGRLGRNEAIALGS